MWQCDAGHFKLKMASIPALDFGLVWMIAVHFSKNQAHNLLQMMMIRIDDVDDEPRPEKQILLRTKESWTDGYRTAAAICCVQHPTNPRAGVRCLTIDVIAYANRGERRWCPLLEFQH